MNKEYIYIYTRVDPLLPAAVVQEKVKKIREYKLNIVHAATPQAHRAPDNNKLEKQTLMRSTSEASSETG